MTKGRISVESVAAIANAIREKLGTTATYKPAEMAPAILSIPTGGTGEEIPKIYVAKKLEHQSIVITPSVLTTPAEIGDKKVYSASVSSVDIKAVPAVGYEAGNIVVNGNVMSKEVNNYAIAGGEQITATAATKIGDSPTLNIYGDLVLSEVETPPSHFKFAVLSEEARINTKSDGYRVTGFFAAGAEDEILVEFTVEGISEFYRNPGIYTTSPINIKIGNVSLVANRGEGENIDAVGTKEDFLRLKENIGKPLNFSIKYE